MSLSEPKRVSLQTVGCRLNQYETERMVVDLYPYGFRRAQPGEKAELYIINTCTVTHRADSSSRYLINKARRENPDAHIVVAGCYVDSDHEEVARIEGVDAVISNQEKPRLAEILSKRLPDLFSEKIETETPDYSEVFGQYNRAWLKVSDGCNQGCAFCILPRVRGSLINRPVHELLDEIHSLVEAGFYEVVLTGLHLGSYEHINDTYSAKNLAELCRLIIRETDLHRIRLSSIEPQTVTDELLQTFTDLGGRICRHIHTPLQSGSARILKLMRRPYDPQQYLDRVAAVRKAVPLATIGADVIVGFPGETDEDFEQTRQLIKQSGIDYLHVFSYSDRAQTAAAEMSEKVEPQTIKDRCSILRELSSNFRPALLQRQIGQVLEVIPQRKKPDGADFLGVADNYIRVRLPHDHPGGRQVVKVRVTVISDDCVSGDIS